MRILILTPLALLSGCAVTGAPPAVADVAIFAAGIAVAMLLWALTIESKIRRLRRSNTFTSNYAARLESALLHDRSFAHKRLGKLLLFMDQQKAAQQKTDAELATLARNLDDTMVRVAADSAPSGKTEVDRLRTELLGGSADDGMPVPGRLSELRQQVEGINSGICNKVKRLESRNEQILKLSAQRAAERAVVAELDKRSGWWQRFVRWVRD